MFPEELRLASALSNFQVIGEANNIKVKSIIVLTTNCLPTLLPANINIELENKINLRSQQLNR